MSVQTDPLAVLRSGMDMLRILPDPLHAEGILVRPVRVTWEPDEKLGLLVCRARQPDADAAECTLPLSQVTDVYIGLSYAPLCTRAAVRELLRGPTLCTVQGRDGNGLTVCAQSREAHEQLTSALANLFERGGRSVLHQTVRPDPA